MDKDHEWRKLRDWSQDTKMKTKLMTNVDSTDNIQIDRTEIENVTINIWDKQWKWKTGQGKSLNKNESKMKCFWRVQRNLFGQAPSHESKKKVLQPVHLTCSDIWIPNIVFHESISKVTWNKQWATEGRMPNVKLKDSLTSLGKEWQT